MRRIGVVLLVALALTGCLRKQGDRGLTGLTGPAGKDTGGYVYRNIVFHTSSGGTYPIDAHQWIQGKEGFVMVNVYYSYDQKEWFPITDGWIDPNPNVPTEPLGSRLFSINYTTGFVYIYFAAPGDYLKVEVFDFSTQPPTATTPGSV